MADLTTTYMGLALQTPVIASSSGLTGNVDSIKRCVDAGVGAVVLKSMFQELIDRERQEIDEHLADAQHPEAVDALQSGVGLEVTTEPYLKLVSEAKAAVGVPVIASVHCEDADRWIPFARRLESAGADALELNISHFPRRWYDDSETIERRYAEIVERVSSEISIPVAAKVGYYFTTLWNTLTSLSHSGARAVVLFNRYYDIDVDLDTRRPIFSMRMSGPEELSLPLRWVGLAASRLSCDVSASTGIHDAEAVVKVLMMGASVAQVASVLYRRGPEHARVLIDGVAKWMDENGVDSVTNLKGLALRNAGDPEELLMRLQYVRELERAGAQTDDA